MKDTLQLTKRKDIPFFSLPLWEKINVCGHGFFFPSWGAVGEGRIPLIWVLREGRALTVLENREVLGIWRKKNSALFVANRFMVLKLLL